MCFVVLRSQGSEWQEGTGLGTEPAKELALTFVCKDHGKAQAGEGTDMCYFLLDVRPST